LVLLAFAAPASALEVTRHEQLSPRLHEYGFTTPSLAGETNVRILLPAGYDAESDRRYPVLYLLHGCCDFDVPGSRAWTVHGEAEEATAGLDLIVVMPDGGRGGFYSDWYRNGLGGPPKWETYHLGELLPWVDEELRTIPSREGRVIAGLSMGGFGAMSYAARHPDLFVAAASFSGAVDTNLDPTLIDALSAQDGGGPGSVWGLRQTEEARWRGHNPWDLAENLRPLQLALRTGNGEPGPLDEPGSGSDAIEAGVHDMTVSLHQRLEALGIAHTFDDYGPGTHKWPYWARDLRASLPEQMAVLAKPPAPPARVTYVSAEPRYAVFGWQVAFARTTMELTRLSAARARGFALEGTGTAEVVTPPRYVRGAAGTVTVDGERREARAGDDGRVTVAVPLDDGRADVAIDVPRCAPARVVTVRLPRGARRARFAGQILRGRRVRVDLRPYAGKTVRLRAAGRVVRRWTVCG
jgi:S-formylglutathione hydrolase FrmB